MPDALDTRELPLENPLSEREMEVASLLVTGASNAEIARELIISPHTVKVHLRNIFEKLQVNSRTEASMVLVKRGWVAVPGVTIEPDEGEEPTPPEPPPLAPLSLRSTPWQRAYMAASLLFCLLLLGTPFLSSWQGRTTAALLTDSHLARTAAPAARLEPRWELRTPLKRPLARLAMTALDDRLFVMGGETPAGEAVADMQIYDLSINDWSTGTPLPLPLANLAAATLNGHIYVAGGSTNPDAPGANPVPVDKLLQYDVAQDEWSELLPLPYPVAGAGMAADDRYLYVVGGWDGRNMHDEVWRIEPALKGATAVWELVGHLSKARAYVGVAAAGGELYVVGGYDGQREYDLAEALNPISGQRRELPALGTPRGGVALVYDGLALYALGGGWTQPLTTHERFDLTSNSWSNFTSPIQGEWRSLAATGVNGRLHIAGGWAGDYLDSHLQYQSSFRALLPVITSD